MVLWFYCDILFLPIKFEHANQHYQVNIHALKDETKKKHSPHTFELEKPREIYTAQDFD